LSGLFLSACLLLIALPFLDTIRFESTAEKTHVYLQQGQEYFKEDKYQEALIVLKNVLKLDPTMAQAHYYLGRIYLKMGLFVDGFAALGQSVRLAPHLTEAQLELGKLYLLAKDLARARAKAQLVLEQEPGRVEGHLLLGEIAAAEEQFAEALAAVNTALQLDPDRLESSLTLAQVYFLKKDLKQTERTLQQAVARHPTASEAHMALGLYYQAIGQWQQAEQAYRAAIRVEPQKSRTHFLLGQLFVLQNQPDTATQLMQRALDLNPASLEIKKHLIYVLLAQDRTAQAQRLVEDILTGHREEVDAFYLKGRILLMQNHFQEAITYLKRVKERKRDYAFGPYKKDLSYYLGLAYVKNGQLDQAREELQSVLELYPTLTQVKLLVAELSLKLGDAWEAISHAEEVLRAEPRNLQAFLLLGQASLHVSRLQEATTVFQTATTLAPKQPQGYYGLGLAYQRQRQLQKAITAFETVLTLDADAVEALAQLTVIHQASGQSEKALARCAAQLERSPNNAGLHQLMGTLLLRQAQGKKAEEHFRKAIALDGNHPQPYFFLGMLHEQRGNYPEAKAQYERALTLAPTFAQAANNLAWLYAEHGGDLDRALSLAKMAREHLPDDASVGDTLGWIYYKKNSVHHAIVLLEESAKKNHTNPTIHYHLGMAYYKKGEYEAARRALAQSLALNPAHADAPVVRQTLAVIQQNESRR
jgi:tetratricopeptide (TPR) repeat protein